jgi:hypothetical protein
VDPHGSTRCTQEINRSDPRVAALLLRVGTLEKTVAALKEHVERDLGPLFPPPEWFDEDGKLKPVELRSPTLKRKPG